MSEETAILVDRQGTTGIITLYRPDKMNALTLEMLNELACQVQTFEYDDGIRAIIIQGNNQAFVAGIDIQELGEEAAQQSFAMDLWYEEFNKIANCSKPIIAAVSGYALGIGCELAMACDIVLASDTAAFGHPEISLGFLPVFGACTKLVHRIGKAKTMEMILTGKALNVEEAEHCGLVSRIVPLADLSNEALRVAQRIAAQPYQAVMQSKETIKQVENMNLQNGMDLEAKSCKLSLNTQEFSQRLDDFMQNRQ